MCCYLDFCRKVAYIVVKEKDFTYSRIIRIKALQEPEGIQKPYLGAITKPVQTETRIQYYSAYLKKRFGVKVRKITVDAGFTCPNRDGSLGTDGCIYCDNTVFSPAYRHRNHHRSISAQLEEAINRNRLRAPNQKYIAYFQPFTNTYAPVEVLEKKYLEALSHPMVVGIAIGTRPDCISDAVLDLLEHLNHRAYVSIEYGCESVYDKTLQWVRRGHTFHQLTEAVRQTAARSLEVGLHYILGFPTESREEMVDSATILSALPFQRLKIHHLHIPVDTPLADEYGQYPFPLPDADAYVRLVTDFLERLAPDILIERLCADSPPELTIAPLWHLRGAEIQRRVLQEMIRRNTAQGYFYHSNQKLSLSPTRDLIL